MKTPKKYSNPFFLFQGDDDGIDKRKRNSYFSKNKGRGSWLMNKRFFSGFTPRRYTQRQREKKREKDGERLRYIYKEIDKEQERNEEIKRQREGKV